MSDARAAGSERWGPDPERIPDLTELPRRPRGAPRPGSRRARKAEAAIVKAEAAVQAGARGAGAAPAFGVVAVADGVPHVRLGVAWAAMTAAAAYGGKGWLAVWLAPVAGLAAVQVAGAHRRAGARPLPGLAAAAGAGVPLAAIAGAQAVAAMCAAGTVAVLVGRLVRAAEGRGRALDDVASTLLAAFPPGLAAAAPVLVHALGRAEAVVLVAFVLAYDAGAFLAGAEAAGRWEGPLTGAACTVPVTLAVAALLPDRFPGPDPWVLGAVAVVTAPLGPLVARVLVPGGRAPALGRLDSLLVAGPVWAWAALALAR